MPLVRTIRYPLNVKNAGAEVPQYLESLDGGLTATVKSYALPWVAGEVLVSVWTDWIGGQGSVLLSGPGFGGGEFPAVDEP